MLEATFGAANLHTAIAREDLAYATYVHEYNAGRFDDAHAHAERALAALQRLLPPDHLLLASARRVLALILEEIAIDATDKAEKRELLVRGRRGDLQASLGM